jgi:hypothetical protein
MRMVFDNYDEAVAYGDAVLSCGYCVEANKEGIVESI